VARRLAAPRTQDPLAQLRGAAGGDGDRPRGAALDQPAAGAFGGDAIERLFTNRLDWSAHPYYETIRGLAVSTHFLIRRDGALQQFVSCDDRAWHAGPSSWQGREGCNDFSIGIELEGLEGDAFDDRQYPVLGALLESVAARYPIRAVAGHEHVAPGRRNDPGAGFDWARLRRALAATRLVFAA
jgi:AmpD protein